MLFAIVAVSNDDLFHQPQLRQFLLSVPDLGPPSKDVAWRIGHPVGPAVLPCCRGINQHADVAVADAFASCFVCPNVEVVALQVDVGQMLDDDLDVESA